MGLMAMAFCIEAGNMLGKLAAAVNNAAFRRKSLLVSI